jgi:SAM-dependent methyltransferase
MDLQKKKFNNVRIYGRELLISGLRQRTNYLLHIAIFKATTNYKLPTITAKYDELKFLSTTELLEVTGGVFGACISLYFQSLVNLGILPSTVEYLEVPPEIADSDRKLEDYSPEELWELAGLNYPLLLKGEYGGDGHFIRILTIEKKLEEFIGKEISQGVKVLDLGCGDGSLLEKIGNKTEFAYGLELVGNILENHKTTSKRVYVGTLYDAPGIFKDICFDWVILNLVLSWISNLEDAVRAIRLLLRKNGKVLVTLTPPEFTKNGQWIKKNDKFYWLTTKPLRREKELKMINRLIGPLWFYPRSTIDYLNIFGNKGLYCIGAKEIYIDTYLSAEEYSKVLRIYPSLIRHQMLPVFTILKFIKK